MPVADDDVGVCPDDALFDATDTDTTDVVVVVDCGNQKFCGFLVVAFGAGDMAQNGFKKRDKIFAFRAFGKGARTFSAAAIDDGAVQLFVGGVKVNQKSQNFFHDLVNTRVGTVDFVYADDYFKPER